MTQKEGKMGETKKRKAELLGREIGERESRKGKK